VTQTQPPNPADVSQTADPALARVLARIRELGLDSHIVELETQGFTTLKAVLSERTVGRALDAIVGRVERTTGRKVDLQNETGEDAPGLNYLPYMLYDDEVFEEILMEPAPLALITYLLGESCMLSSLGSHFKLPGGAALPLHSDNGNGMPAPFSPISEVANVNYALTPYSREAGALALVPGSHKLARQPRPREAVLGGEKTNRWAQSMDLEPGDAVVWHGNTWHGSFERKIPGARVNLAVYFARQHIRSQEHHGDTVPAEVLARHSGDERFKTLLGGKQPYGWRHEGPDYALMAQSPRGLYD